MNGTYVEEGAENFLLTEATSYQIPMEMEIEEGSPSEGEEGLYEGGKNRFIKFT
jgi:hypothetical protein